MAHCRRWADGNLSWWESVKLYLFWSIRKCKYILHAKFILLFRHLCGQVAEMQFIYISCNCKQTVKRFNKKIWSKINCTATNWITNRWKKGGSFCLNRIVVRSAGRIISQTGRLEPSRRRGDDDDAKSGRENGKTTERRSCKWVNFVKREFLCNCLISSGWRTANILTLARVFCWVSGAAANKAIGRASHMTVPPEAHPPPPLPHVIGQ